MRKRRAIGQSNTFEVKDTPFNAFFKDRDIPIPKGKAPPQGSDYSSWHKFVSDDNFYVCDKQTSVIIDLWMGYLKIPEQS